MKYCFIAIIFFLITSTSVMAETFKTENELKPFTESVMVKVAANDVESAFKLMSHYVVISDDEFQSMALKSKSVREQYGKRYGNTIGYEFISQQKVGDSLISIVYIEKTQKHALPWSFYFYKTPQGWVLNTFTWSDEMHKLFYTN
jgi:hypothetical protein